MDEAVAPRDAAIALGACPPRLRSQSFCRVARRCRRRRRGRSARRSPRARTRRLVASPRRASPPTRRPRSGQCRSVPIRWTRVSRSRAGRRSRSTCSTTCCRDDITGHTLLRAGARRGGARRARAPARRRPLHRQQRRHAGRARGLSERRNPPVQSVPVGSFDVPDAMGASRSATSRASTTACNNKMFIADGAFAIAGGRNIADEYFFSSKGGNFVDFDLLVAGAAVPRMQSVFDTYWNSPRVYPLAGFESSREPAQTLRAAFERRTADAIAAYPSPPSDAPDILGYLALSADIAHSPLRMLKGSIDVFADSPEKVTGRAEPGRRSDDGHVAGRPGDGRSQVGGGRRLAVFHSRQARHGRHEDRAAARRAHRGHHQFAGVERRAVRERRLRALSRADAQARRRTLRGRYDAAAQRRADRRRACAARSAARTRS